MPCSVKQGMLVFETARLKIREYTERDVPAMFRMYGDPVVIQYLGVPPMGAPVPDLDDMARRLEAIQAKVHGEDRFGYWAIEFEGRVVGTVLLKRLPGVEDFEVGWHLAQAEWGHGFATEAAQGAVEFGFREWSLDEVFAIAYKENVRSLKVMDRLGMTALGPTTKFHGVELELYHLAKPV